MIRHYDSILLLDHETRNRSICAQTLDGLGYHRISFASISRSDNILSTAEPIDVVVAAWTSELIDIHLFQRVVTNATGLPKARGAVIVSPFSTADNAKQRRKAGARAWVRYPFSSDEFERHLRHVLDNERRQRFETIPFDRRRSQPNLFPNAFSATTA